MKLQGVQVEYKQDGEYLRIPVADCYGGSRSKIKKDQQRLKTYQKRYEELKKKNEKEWTSDEIKDVRKYQDLQIEVMNQKMRDIINERDKILQDPDKSERWFGRVNDDYEGFDIDLQEPWEEYDTSDEEADEAELTEDQRKELQDKEKEKDNK